MTTSPRWRSVVASAAAAAALFAAPLAGAVTAYADSYPSTPHQTHTPNREHGSDEDGCKEHGSEEHGSDEDGCKEHGSEEHGSDEDGCKEHGCDNDEKRPDKPELAHTGADHTKEAVLGGAAAALIAAGAGTVLIARRRSNS
ncbi:hypothetical protein SRB17_83430 [Streptomyces sp. RB17]|nr:hypothetical protein [Streptomyces sp. RB17]MQY40310.1 hypothetical protein [Streptomyces sp. RB17]